MIKRIVKSILVWVSLFGFEPLRFISFLKNFPWYLRDFRNLKKQLREKKLVSKIKLFPVLHERNDTSGTMTGHYFLQDLLVAQRIFKHNPIRHADFGSRTDGFVSHVASFREIEIFDIRKQDSKINNIVFVQLDIMSIPEELHDSFESISCLHVLEHLGLGRYSDPINVNGHIIGLQNLGRLLKKGGRLYLSFPIGEDMIMFNAHRILGIDNMVKEINNYFTIDYFSYIDDKSNLIENVPYDKELGLRNYDCSFGLAIFELIKN